MASTTLATLLREIVADLFPEHYLEFTALVASTTTAVHGNELHDDEASVETYEGGWLFVYGGAQNNEERRIVSYAPSQSASTGAVTVNRPFASPPDTTSTCFIYAGALSPTRLKALANRALRRMRYKRYLPYTLLEDAGTGDGLMEKVGTAGWTMTNATASKTASELVVAEGKQALNVAATAAGGYAESATQRAFPGERVYVEADVYPTGNVPAKLAVVTPDTGAVLASVEYDSGRQTRLRLSTTVAAADGRFAVRLVTPTSGTNVSWDDVLVWYAVQRRAKLRTVVEDAAVLRVYERSTKTLVTGGTTTAVGSGGVYDPTSERLRPIVGWHVRYSVEGVPEVALDLADADWSGQHPLVVECMVPGTELSASTDATQFDKDDIRILTRAYAYEELARTGPRDTRDFYKEQARLAALSAFHVGARRPRPAIPVGRRS